MKRNTALWIGVVIVLLAFSACKEKKAEESVDLQKAAEEFIQTAQKGDLAKLEGLVTSKYKSKAAYEVERFSVISDCKFKEKKEEKESEGTWYLYMFTCQQKKDDQVAEKKVIIAFIKEGDKYVVGDVD